MAARLQALGLPVLSDYFTIRQHLPCVMDGTRRLIEGHTAMAVYTHGKYVNSLARLLYTVSYCVRPVDLRARLDATPKVWHAITKEAGVNIGIIAPES